LSLQIVKKYIDCVRDLHPIVLNHTLSSDILTYLVQQFKEQWDEVWNEEWDKEWFWTEVSTHIHPTIQLVHEHGHNLDIFALSSNIRLSGQVVHELGENKEWDWEQIAKNTMYLESFLKKFGKLMRLKHVSMNMHSLTIVVVKYYGLNAHAWDWKRVSKNLLVSSVMSKDLVNKLDIRCLSFNKRLTLQLIDLIGVDNVEWDWREISKNVLLSLEDCYRLKRKLYVDELSYNSRSLCVDLISYFGIENKRWNWAAVADRIDLSQFGSM
jgi:hypothetical protein